MKARGFRTTYQLAKATGLPVQTLDKVVQGNKGISYKTLDILCEAFDCEVGELIEHIKTKGKKR
jgi:DNA-binding Xre family transcriptional regulator